MGQCHGGISLFKMVLVWKKYCKESWLKEKRVEILQSWAEGQARCFNLCSLPTQSTNAWFTRQSNMLIVPDWRMKWSQWTTNLPRSYVTQHKAGISLTIIFRAITIIRASFRWSGQNWAKNWHNYLAL